MTQTGILNEMTHKFIRLDGILEHITVRFLFKRRKLFP